MTNTNRETLTHKWYVKMKLVDWMRDMGVSLKTPFDDFPARLPYRVLPTFTLDLATLAVNHGYQVLLESAQELESELKECGWSLPLYYDYQSDSSEISLALQMARTNSNYVEEGRFMPEPASNLEWKKRRFFLKYEVT